MTRMHQQTKVLAPDADDNPLLDEWGGPFGVPDFGRIKPDHFRPAFARGFATHATEVASIGGTSTATRVAMGANSRKRFSRFAATSPLKELIPVRLPPGRARLATKPSLFAMTRSTSEVAVCCSNASAACRRASSA
jgi:hypothetical protein